MMNQLRVFSMMTDCLSFIDFPTIAMMTTEKRLIIDLKTGKDSYRTVKHFNITFVRFEFILAEPLTEIKPNLLLLQVLDTCVTSHFLKQ